MIKINNTSLERLGVIKKTIASSRLEEINGENTLDFEAVLDSEKAALVDENTIYEADGEYFDTAIFSKIANEDNTFTLEVESEHVSYRLNREEYDVEYFTEYGSPTYILGKILEGTEFSVGTVEFAIIQTYSIQESKSRRQLLMEFIASLGGELKVNKFEISIVAHLGSTSVIPVIKNRNVKVVSKKVNKRQLDDAGNPIISYKCTPLYLPGQSYSIGDEVRLIQKEINVSENLRVVSITKDLYDETNIKFELSNYMNGLADSLYQIATTSVTKDKPYNGVRIGPEYGFEAVRSDNKARSFFRSDGLVMQSGDGTGTTWKDRLYYEYDSDTDETTLVFDGKFTASVIEVLTTLITPNLYADKATIAELTVDEVNTSPKVQKYLSSDLSDVNYCKVEGHIIQFITGSVATNYAATRTSSGVWGLTENIETSYYYTTLSVDNSTGTYSLSGKGVSGAYFAYLSGRIYKPIDATHYYLLTGATLNNYVKYDIYTIGEVGDNFEQVKNRKGNLMYWSDDTHTYAQEETTPYPVYSYKYNEFVKQEFTFDYEEGNYVPKIMLGTGTGDGNKGKGFIYKGATGLYIDYYTSDTGELKRIALNDDGVVVSAYDLQSLDIYNNGFTAVYNGEMVAFTWTLDSEGKITKLTTEDLVDIPIGWHEEDM